MRQTRTLIEMAQSAIEWSDWYADARREIRQVSRRARWNRRRFCDVLGLTSPRCAVRRNIRLALHYMATGDHLPAAMTNIRQSIQHYEATGEIRGPKTKPFADALFGDDRAIVFDSWMESAMDVAPKESRKQHVRARMTRRLLDVADALGLSPASAQAAIWMAERESAGFKPIGYPVVEEFERFTTIGE